MRIFIRVIYKPSDHLFQHLLKFLSDVCLKLDVHGLGELARAPISL